MKLSTMVKLKSHFSFYDLHSAAIEKKEATSDDTNLVRMKDMYT